MLLDVRGLGTLVPEESRVIPVTREGLVERINVNVGDVVRADSVLVELSNPDLQQSLIDAELQIRAAEADLANTRATLQSRLLDQQTALANAEMLAERARLQLDAEEQLAKGMNVLREQHARLEAPPPGHKATDGDFVILSVEGFLDGHPLEGSKKTGHLHKVGSKASVLGLEIDQHVLGKAEGDAIEIPQPYPSSHPDVRVAGKTVTFKVMINAVKIKTLPALDDEFAKDCGAYNSLTELQDRLRTEMEKALTREVEEGYKDTIVKRLLETHHFDLPETLVERELEAIIRQYLQQRQRRPGGEGTSTLETSDLAKLRQENREEAARRVKVGLILEAVAEKEHLTVTQEDLDNEIRRLASELKIGQPELVKMIQAGGQDSIEELRARILAEKSLDFVYRNAVIQK